MMTAPALNGQAVIAPAVPVVTAAAPQARNRAALTAARFLHRAWMYAARQAGPYTDGSPSPCCKGDILLRDEQAPGLLWCTNDGTQYNAAGAAS